MSNKAGTLLWNRRRVVLTNAGPGTTLVDTSLQEPGLAFGNSSDAEPPLGVVAASPPANGTPPASRVQVIPMAPLSAWSGITHGEPYFDTTTGTVQVLFHNSGGGPATVNVLFWDPHTLVGPGQAATYNVGG